MSDTFGPDDPTYAEVAALQQQYQRLLHAMQTGVKFEQEWGLSNNQSPKHLRVGVNSALVQDSALVMLLIDKGVITHVEYWESQVAAFEREVSEYEERLSAHVGQRVTLL